MAKNERLQQTKGRFQLKGIVFGAQKEDFFTEKMTNGKTPKLRKNVKFGVKTSPDNHVYVSLNSTKPEKVYFFRPESKKDNLPKAIKAVDWDQRNKFNEPKFKLIGTNVGLAKKLSKDGLEVNDSKILHQFDAIDLVRDNLRDGQSVFIMGHIEYSSFEGRNIKQFIIDQISLCAPIDFQSPNFEEECAFEQTIVWRGIEKDGKEYGKFNVTASIVCYSSIVETEFIVRNPQLANTMREKIEQYDSLQIYGRIIGRVATVEASDDCWGEVNPMQRMSDYSKEMLVKGVTVSTIDNTIYSEEVFDEFIRSKKEFGESVATFGADADDDVEGWQ